MIDAEPAASPPATDGPAAAEGPGPVAWLDAGLAVDLRRFVLGVVRDPDLADDVIQATFVKALEHGDEARAETARGWLFRVAFREALVLRRRSAARAEGALRLARAGARVAESPDAPLIRAETVALVREALEGLPEEQRRVVLARIDDGRTFAQIARDANLPIGTVLTRMRRALEKMRKTLSPGA